MGTPSTTNSGSLPALIEAGPRTRMASPLPGLPAFSITCTPGAFPWRADSTLAVGTFAICSAPTEAIALLTPCRVLVP